MFGSEGISVAAIHPVTTEWHPWRRGHPRKVVDEAYLREAAHPSRNISKRKLARVLAIHQNTLKKKMDGHGINFGYSTIEDPDLDMLVKAYKARKPGAGFRYVRGHLRSVGLRVQKQRVLDTLQRVDRVGRFIRRRAVIRRRKYHSSRPNALWHCDGHHKLIKYGIVIHGFIDGNCRTVRCLVSLATKHKSLIPNSRLLHFVRIQTTLRVRSSSYFYRLWRHTVLRPEFGEIVVGKTSSFLHI